MKMFTGDSASTISERISSVIFHPIRENHEHQSEVPNKFIIDNWNVKISMGKDHESVRIQIESNSIECGKLCMSRGYLHFKSIESRKMYKLNKISIEHLIKNAHSEIALFRFIADKLYLIDL